MTRQEKFIFVLARDEKKLSIEFNIVFWLVSKLKTFIKDNFDSDDFWNSEERECFFLIFFLFKSVMKLVG